MSKSVASCILVTGIEGFVGRWLLEHLRANIPAARIVGTTRSHAPAKREGVEIVSLDVVNREQVRTTIRSLRPTGLIHLAAIASVPFAGRNVQLTWDVNVGGTVNLAEAVLEEAPACRIVFVGTSEAYGHTFSARSGAPLDEDAPLDPANMYAASKAAADLLIGEMARGGLDAVRMRPFNHTGPGQTETYAIPAFAAQIARIEAGLQPSILSAGNLDARRDFLDVRDVVDGYLRALVAQDLRQPAIFNLSSGRPRRVGDVLDALLAQALVPIQVEQNFGKTRPSEMPIAAGSAARALSMLGWQPRIPFEQTLADVLKYWRERVKAENGQWQST